MQEIVLNIEGMKCEGCSNRLTNILENIDGVTSVNVSLEDKKVELEIDENEISIEEIKDEINEAGFEAIEE